MHVFSFYQTIRVTKLSELFSYMCQPNFAIFMMTSYNKFFLQIMILIPLKRIEKAVSSIIKEGLFAKSNISLASSFMYQFSTSKFSSSDYEQLQVKNKNDWRKWLDTNYASVNGIWLKVFKKSSKSQSVRYDEALDEALCYGWIDGQRKSNDAQSFFQKFTPRRTNSQWSKRNKEIADRLMLEGRMMPPGISQIERAKKDGRWQKCM